MNGEIRRAKIENILKCIESYKLCGNILFVGGNPPKKRCSQPLRGSKKSGVRHQIKLYNLKKSELKKERVFLFGMLSLIYLMNK